MVRALEGFYKKQKTFRRSYDINDSMYEKLEYLSNNVYEGTVNKIVCAAIDHIIKTRAVKLYMVKPPEHLSKRTFYFPECLVTGLEQLSAEYSISIAKLVNIAIYNLLEEETEHFKNESQII